MTGSARQSRGGREVASVLTSNLAWVYSAIAGAGLLGSREPGERMWGKGLGLSQLLQPEDLGGISG